VSERANRTAWQGRCYQLKLRNVRQVDLRVTDDNPAVFTAVSYKFPDVAHQDCVRHII
jgi:transposase-like protein